MEGHSCWPVSSDAFAEHQHPGDLFWRRAYRMCRGIVPYHVRRSGIPLPKDGMLHHEATLVGSSVLTGRFWGRFRKNQPDAAPSQSQVWCLIPAGRLQLTARAHSSHEHIKPHALHARVWWAAAPVYLQPRPSHRGQGYRRTQPRNAADNSTATVHRAPASKATSAPDPDNPTASSRLLSPGRIVSDDGAAGFQSLRCDYLWLFCRLTFQISVDRLAN